MRPPMVGGPPNMMPPPNLPFLPRFGMPPSGMPPPSMPGMAPSGMPPGMPPSGMQPSGMPPPEAMDRFPGPHNNRFRPPQVGPNGMESGSMMPPPFRPPQFNPPSFTPPVRPPQAAPPSRNTVVPRPPIMDKEGQMWLEACTAAGKVYYFNAKTRVTQWTKPEVAGEPQSPSIESPNPSVEDEVMNKFEKFEERESPLHHQERESSLHHQER